MRQSEYKSEIGIDVERTFPHLKLFSNQNKAEAMLSRILNAISNYMPSLGYVQGMNFIAASLLLILCNEEDTFWVLIALLQAFRLKDMYLQSFIKMKLLCS
jgi:hypothetical protein